jgi:hypothetical protein
MRFFVSLLLFLTASLMQAEWMLTKQVALEKDQYQSVLVKEEEIIRLLKFRWTLYAGDGLVVHLNYNENPSQFILYKQYKKDTFKLALLPKRSKYKRVPFLYLVFNKFDDKQNRAYFDIFIDDPKKQALIEVKESK